MNKEIADAWVAALRSGEFEKGTKALRTVWDDKECFCCLGVLCELYHKVERKGEWQEPDKLAVPELRQAKPFIIDKGKTFSDMGIEVLPETVREWAGLHRTNGAFLSGTYCLSELNDHGSSFEEIADLIEKNWEAL